LGEYFVITGNFMKLHASCRETHGAVAALAAARGKALFNPDDVLRVEIETFADAARLSEAEPVSEMAARFSIQASVAAAILDGSVAVDSFAPGRLERQALKTLMQRVVVREVPDANAALPEVRICRCRIVLSDATVLAGEVQAAPGDSGSPLSIGELQAKFDALCARVTGQEGAAPATKALRRFLS
jgi:2-methylcitrate dehydratase PrpD